MYNYKLLFFLTFVVSLSATAARRQQVSEARPVVEERQWLPVKKGQPMPEEFWKQTLTTQYEDGTTAEIVLESLKGKLILVDFWATWCSSCIESFTKMEHLQELYGDKIAVLLVNAKQTGDTDEKISRVLARRFEKLQRRLSLPLILGDTIFENLIPHRVLPHIAWIGSDGTLLATTDAQQVSHITISDYLHSGHLSVLGKRDIVDFDTKEPLLDHGLSRFDTRPRQSAMLTGYIDGVGNTTGNLQIDEYRQRLYMLNTTISELYRRAYANQLGQIPGYMRVLEVSDTSFLRKLSNEDDDRSNLFCYELITIGKTNNEQELMMQQDLKNAFGVEVFVEKIATPVIVIRGHKNFEHIKASRGIREYNFSDSSKPFFLYHQLISFFSRVLSARTSTIVVDESGLSTYIDLDLPAEIFDFSTNELVSWLKAQGFQCDLEERMLDFAVYKDIKQ